MYDFTKVFDGSRDLLLGYVLNEENRTSCETSLAFRPLSQDAFSGWARQLTTRVP